ncbi:hypothetical protein H1D32_10745 [Anaerobacillus sp. CMMVII]|uniref:hypothetical protein n=1 Tax=Anaerobacillus sp. CMMVII TaxID=2755588 RepID=UPI0021B84BF3|nr:hypothetical protein [Anaerobacillus sp. CMMVII]MCT8138190.1 hypothetical protein [Anaerobacillus sp. CMMVII]
MKFSRKAIITSIVIVSLILIFGLFKEDLWEVNEALLKKEVLSIDENIKHINLQEVTPFEWDVMYSFAPYTSKDQIYDVVGYKWDKITETVSEGMNQIVFLKDGKVVCYLYGYPENNGYGIYFLGENFKGVASKLSVKEDLDFQVTRSNGVIYLQANK